VGIEALSRGAARAIFLEKNRKAVEVIRENLAQLGVEERALVVPGPVLPALPRYPANILFLDPPYALQRECGSALGLLGESPSPLVVVQHSVRFELKETYGRLRRTRLVKQGDNALSFFASG
jgi:16S rRNA G966 N2-methylase RsmD